MVHSLNGKVVLVTGAASGIGASVVKHLLDEDVKYVAMLDVADEAGLALQDELNMKYKGNRVKFIKCDVTVKQSMLDAFQIVRDKNGPIDLVVNSAGIMDDTLDSYVKEININLVALITSSLYAWNIMNKEKGGAGGTIINFSSIAGISKTVSLPIYSATKSAVLKFSTSLGDEIHYARSGVRVITVCFGVTNTPMLRAANRLFDDSFRELLVEQLNQLKLQSPKAAANAVIDVYKQGASGSVWISTSDRPALDITKTIDKSVELFDDLVYT